MILRRAGAALAAGTLALSVAACGGSEGPVSVIPPEDADVRVTGTDALKFEPSELGAGAGEVAIALTSGPAVPHNVVIEEAGNTMVVEAGPGGTAAGTIELEAGAYTFYCSVPGHRRAGMEGTLTVD